MKTMFLMLWNDPQRANKFIVALVGAAITAVALGLLPAATGDYVTVLVAFLTALGVYVVPNKEVSHVQD